LSTSLALEYPASLQNAPGTTGASVTRRRTAPVRRRSVRVNRVPRTRTSGNRTSDRLGNRQLIGADQLAQILGIDAIAGLRTREQLHVRLGIASGLVVVGDLIGQGATRERDVVGETPNLAARLQALAAPGTVIVADRADSTDRHNTIFVGLSGDTGGRPRVASL